MSFFRLRGQGQAALRIHMKTAGKNICHLNDIHIFNRAGTQYDLPALLPHGRFDGIGQRVVQNDAQVEGIQSALRRITEFTAKGNPLLFHLPSADRQHCVRHGIAAADLRRDLLHLRPHVLRISARLLILSSAVQLFQRHQVVAHIMAEPAQIRIKPLYLLDMPLHILHLCRKYPALPVFPLFLLPPLEYIHHHQDRKIAGQIIQNHQQRPAGQIIDAFCRRFLIGAFVKLFHSIGKYPQRTRGEQQ